MIILSLTSQEVKLLYTEDNGTIVPLPSSNTSFRYSNYGGNGSQRVTKRLVDALIARIREILNTSDTAVLMGTPLLVASGMDVDRKDVDRMVDLLRNNGFSTVNTADVESAVARKYESEPAYDGVVTVNANGTDIHLALSFRSQPGRMARKTLVGLGNDPRVEQVAAKIWEYIREDTVDLRYEDQHDQLVEAARRFLDSKLPEVEDEVRLSDGYYHTYCLNRTRANFMESDDTARLQDEFTELLERYDASDRSRLALVLRNRAIDNEYLMHNITAGFKYVVNLQDQLLQDVVRQFSPGCDFAAYETEPEPLAKPQPRPATPPSFNTNPAATAPTGQAAPTVGTFTDTFVPDDTPAKDPARPVGMPTIDIAAEIVTEKTGLFKKKRSLKIRVSSPDIQRLPWRSVLLVQDKPLFKIQDQNVVKEFDRDDDLPFIITIPLPLPQCPDASSVMIYFKPDPSERVGINEAYRQRDLETNIK